MTVPLKQAAVQWLTQLLNLQSWFQLFIVSMDVFGSEVGDDVVRDDYDGFAEITEEYRPNQALLN